MDVYIISPFIVNKSYIWLNKSRYYAAQKCLSITIACPLGGQWDGCQERVSTCMAAMYLLHSHNNGINQSLKVSYIATNMYY